jgi:molybdopterin-guanine dinucleotide biosynthesis protein A
VTCAGVLLTGGASRRMGVDKATIVVDGETLATRAARVLGTVCDPVIEVGPGVTNLPCTREDPPGGGPLAALVAGATALDARMVILLGCDYPFVNEELLRLVADWPGTRTAIPIAGGRMQYACARYGPAAFDAAHDVLMLGRGSLAAVAEIDCDTIPEETWRAEATERALDDIDTPQDMRRLGLS